VVRNEIANPSEGITDVFLASHGWQGDIPAAIEQYDRWVGEMARSADREAAHSARPGFKSIVVGLHWPSLPFGNEAPPADQGGEGGLLGAEDEPDIDAQVEQYAASIADTPKAREAIRTILLANREDDGSSKTLPTDVREAYQTLYAEADLDGGDGDPGAPPGADREEFDPDAIYEAARVNAAAEEEEATGGGVLDGGFLDKLKGFVVAPLQQMSFWKMKDRARAIGESGAHALLARLMKAARPETRFHLMGHSFGCIVVSATVAGAPGGEKLPRPVDSLFLVQGALSLWSYCPDIPMARGTAGYFNRTLKEGFVRGPIVTTRSRFDTAVGRLYPTAVRLGNQFVLADDLPKFGGIGTFGAQGLGALAVDRELGAADTDYGFQNGRVYNLDANGVIKNGGGFSGAHSDIAHPEVAHVMWQAALTPP
ncbi:MAG TPA: hypothetical protein VF461_24755, partial [Gemmatimonadaceae bacterium]